MLVDVLVAVGSAPWTASELLVVALAMLALAGAMGSAGRSIVVTLDAGIGSPAGARIDPPLPRGLATDPAHHPIAPRAPGLD